MVVLAISVLTGSGLGVAGNTVAEEVVASGSCASVAEVSNEPMGAETVEREIQYLQGSTVLGQADLASLGSYENHIGAVIQTDSGEKLHAVAGRDENDAITVVRPLSGADGVRVIKSSNQNGSLVVDEVSQHGAMLLNSGHCARFDQGCLDRVKEDRCARGNCGWAFWNPVVMGACLFAQCMTLYYNCCEEFNASDPTDPD